MAGMYSAYPVAGGQYNWVAFRAQKKARGVTYIFGRFILIGILAMRLLASNHRVQHGCLLILIDVPTATNNSLTADFLIGISNLNNPDYIIERRHTVLVACVVGIFYLLVNVCVFLIIITIMIPSVNDHKQSTAHSICSYDAPAHMVEELQNAKKEAPQAVEMSVYTDAVTGLEAFVAACFCMHKIGASAGSSTGVAMIEIL